MNELRWRKERKGTTDTRTKHVDRNLDTVKRSAWRTHGVRALVRFPKFRCLWCLVSCSWRETITLFPGLRSSEHDGWALDDADLSPDSQLRRTGLERKVCATSSRWRLIPDRTFDEFVSVPDIRSITRKRSSFSHNTCVGLRNRT